MSCQPNGVCPLHLEPIGACQPTGVSLFTGVSWQPNDSQSRFEAFSVGYELNTRIREVEHDMAKRITLKQEQDVVRVGAHACGGGDVKPSHNGSSRSKENLECCEYGCVLMSSRRLLGSIK